MSLLCLLPVILSFLLIAAHFMRAGAYVLMGLALLLPLVLLFRRAWAARLVQVGLLLAAVEWMLTMWLGIQERQRFDEAWTRYAIILGSVTLFTVASAWCFFLPPLRRRYFTRPAGFEVRTPAAEAETPGAEPTEASDI